MKPSPEVYNKFNSLQLLDSSNEINKFKTEFNSSKSGLMVVDIGSGSGNVTKNIVLKHFSSYYVSKIVGLDKESEMVEFAKSFYPDPKIDYEIFDMNKLELPPKYIAKFHVLTSFYSFHWMNQPSAIKIMNRLLQPNGEALVVLFLSSTYSNILLEMQHEQKWKNYIQDVPVPFSYNLKNDDEYRRFFEDNGFSVRRIEMKNIIHKFNTPSEVRMFLEPVNVFKSKLSDEMFDELMTESLERNVLSMKEMIKPDVKDISSMYSYTMIVIDAKKVKEI